MFHFILLFLKDFTFLGKMKERKLLSKLHSLASTDAHDDFKNRGTQDNEKEERQNDWTNRERILLGLRSVSHVVSLVDIRVVLGTLSSSIAFGNRHGEVVLLCRCLSLSLSHSFSSLLSLERDAS